MVSFHDLEMDKWPNVAKCLVEVPQAYSNKCSGTKIIASCTWTEARMNCSGCCNNLEFETCSSESWWILWNKYPLTTTLALIWIQVVRKSPWSIVWNTTCQAGTYCKKVPVKPCNHDALWAVFLTLRSHHPKEQSCFVHY